MSDNQIRGVRWQDFALCPIFPPSIFFEEYETDVRTARLTDEICLSCPVRVACLQSGIENNEWGVWGGIFLTSGKIDTAKNGHKTPEIWKRVKVGIE